ncbi:MAG: peptidylprolyl isomerase [Sandaracinaceae bacterium]
MLAGALGALGCGDAEAPSAAPSLASPSLASPSLASPSPTELPPTETEDRTDPLPTLVAATDARAVTPLLQAARAASPVERRAAVWGLARLHDDAAVPGLVAALRDEDPEVRRAAAFGLGALERDAPDEAVEALLGALAAEPEAASPTGVEPVEATFVWSLARTGRAVAVPALVHALGARSELRIAACRGLVYAPDAWPSEVLSLALARAAEDPSLEVREACGFALGRVLVPEALRERAADHALAVLSTPLPGPTDAGLPIAIELHVHAARLLGRLPATTVARQRLADATISPQWRVAVAALRALGALSTDDPASFAEALRAVIAHWLYAGPLATDEPSLPGSEPDSPNAVLAIGPTAPVGATAVLLTALEASETLARDERVHAVAVELHTRLERGAEGLAPRDRALVHCAAAVVVDVGRGWPSRVERCGHDLIDLATRRALAAEVLGLVPGADPQRAAFLRRLWDATDLGSDAPRARQAVLGAAATLPLEHALPFALEGLAADDDGVRIAALELVRALAPMARRARDDAALQASLEGRAQARPPRFLPELDRPLVRLGALLRQREQLEARVAFAGAVEALADPGSEGGQILLAEAVQPFARDASVGVRSAARRALAALEEEVSGSPAAPSNTVSASALALDAVEARLETDRGVVVLELWPERAPTTVTRFVELAEAGFFDGLSFHRVVPGFVVQGGDPRGDGYGGPAFWQRCEDHLAVYERGVVGMALAGRDTGGSQFFITQGRQHHLEGRYTAFGRVREGMHVVDALQVGDTLRNVSVVRGPARRPYPPYVTGEAHAADPAR